MTTSATRTFVSMTQAGDYADAQEAETGIDHTLWFVNDGSDGYWVVEPATDHTSD